MRNGAQRIIGLISGIINAILVLRLVLKLLGANPGNVFISGIYGLTQPIVGIFEGIFAQIALPGINATAVFEPGTLIALVVVALIAWILRKVFSS
ncbi:MAG: YggT family protein [Acetobacterium sp.]